MPNYVPPPSGGAGAVTSVATRTGDVVLAEADIASLTADLALKATDSLVAHLAGAETITGAKLFSAGQRLDSQSISGTATLVDGSQPLVLTDTTAAAFTLTLPAAPSAGSSFMIADSLGTWNTNNLTIGRNGKTIDGVAANTTHVTQYGVIEYLYDGTGWRSKIRQLSQASPAIDGTAAAGTSLKVSREDHVHPTDTSRAALASPGTFTGTMVIPSGATGTSQSAADRSAKLATTLYADRSVELAATAAWSMPTNAVAATLDRSSSPIAATRTVTTAILYLTALYIPTGTVISNFNAISAATSASGTHCWFALFNNSRVQLATTADDTSAAAFTADTTKTQAVATIASGASSTFTTTYSGLHYVGLCVVFTGTAPTIRCTAVNSVIGGVAPITQGNSNSTQTTPNAFAFTANALTATSNRDYVWLT